MLTVPLSFGGNLEITQCLNWDPSVFCLFTKLNEISSMNQRTARGSIIHWWETTSLPMLQVQVCVQLRAGRVHLVYMAQVVFKCSCINFLHMWRIKPTYSQPIKHAKNYGHDLWHTRYEPRISRLCNIQIGDIWKQPKNGQMAKPFYFLQTVSKKAKWQPWLLFIICFYEKHMLSTMILLLSTTNNEIVELFHVPRI